MPGILLWFLLWPFRGGYGGGDSPQPGGVKHVRATSPFKFQQRTMQNISELERWLHDHSCRDILMPAVPGEKHPMFPHADGRWHWGLFSRWNKKRGEGHKDIGILLRTLCVVDVDCMAIADELELRFPLLKLVPAEKTRKGMHYYFRRSTLADRDGYYDSRSPVIKAVDLKTVTSTGTSGFIVTAPSPNKTWIRALWEFNEVPEIPDDILKAVARASHEGVDLRIRCAGDKMIRMPSCRFALMSPYMKMFFDSEFTDTKGVVHLPTYSQEVISEAFNSLESGYIEFDSERVHDVLELYDYVALPYKLVDTIKHDSAEIHRIKSTQPLMAAACKSFRTVTVDVSLASRVILRKNVDAEPYEVFRAKPDESIIGLESLRPNPAQALENALPTCVRRWMRDYPGKLVTAGGFVLGAVAEYVSPGSDIDLYVVADNEPGANAIVHRIAQECSTAVYTGYALTLTHPESTIDIQLILVLNNSADDVIKGFDLHPCQVYGTYGTDGKPAVTASETWVEALRDRCYPIHSNTWSDSSTMRIAKYCAKGFRAYVPGLYRAAVEHWKSTNVQNKMTMFHRAEYIWRHCLLQAVGIEQLFITECFLKRSGHRYLDHHAYSYISRYARYMRKSDYQNYVKKTGAWKYIVDAVIRYCAGRKCWFNEYSPDKVVFWRTHHSKTKCVAIGARDSNIEQWVGDSPPP